MRYHAQSATSFPIIWHFDSLVNRDTRFSDCRRRDVVFYDTEPLCPELGELGMLSDVGGVEIEEVGAREGHRIGQVSSSPTAGATKRISIRAWLI